jgi:hypothetical protein
MGGQRGNGAEQVATYEVCLRGTIPDSLCRSTGMAVRAVRPETVLFRRVRDVRELDTLLDRLRQTGLVLAEVHAAPAPKERASEDPVAGEGGGPQRPRYCEVRVRGKLGDKLLGYLGWSHRLDAERQVARGEVSPHELDVFLSHCAAAGLAVDHVRRIATGGPSEPAL